MILKTHTNTRVHTYTHTRNSDLLTCLPHSPTNGVSSDSPLHPQHQTSTQLIFTQISTVRTMEQEFLRPFAGWIVTLAWCLQITQEVLVFFQVECTEILPILCVCICLFFSLNNYWAPAVCQVLSWALSSVPQVAGAQMNLVPTYYM